MDSTSTKIKINFSMELDLKEVRALLAKQEKKRKREAEEMKPEKDEVKYFRPVEPAQPPPPSYKKAKVIRPAVTRVEVPNPLTIAHVSADGPGTPFPKYQRPTGVGAAIKKLPKGEEMPVPLEDNKIYQPTFRPTAPVPQEVAATQDSVSIQPIVIQPSEIKPMPIATDQGSMEKSATIPSPVPSSSGLQKEKKNKGDHLPKLILKRDPVWRVNPSRKGHLITNADSPTSPTVKEEKTEKEKISDVNRIMEELEAEISKKTDKGKCHFEFITYYIVSSSSMFNVSSI